MSAADLDPQQLQRWIEQQTTGWTSDERAALNERVTREATRIRVSRAHPTAGALAKYVDPKTIQTPALDAIDENLEWALRARDARLLITVGPQEGKSTRASVWGSIRGLQLNPDWRLVLVSYAEHIARGHSQAARNIIREHGSEARDPITGTRVEDKLGLALASDKSAAGSWSLKGHRGGMYVGGLSSGITGKAADCVSEDTYITTEYGHITAADAYERKAQWILGFDHHSSTPSWRRMEASRRINSRPTVEVVTDSGRVLTCTPDHRIHTSRGYTAARDLRTGDSLRTVGDADPVLLRANAHQENGGDPESDCTGSLSLLLDGLFKGCAVDKEPAPLLPMRWPDPAIAEGHLLRCVQPGDRGEERADPQMPAMPQLVPAQVDAHSTLLTRMRESRSFPQNDGPEQLALHDRDKLREMVPVDAPADPRTGWSRMHGVRTDTPADHLHPQRTAGGSIMSGDPSPRRGRHQQHPREPRVSVSDVPCDPPQVTHDAVSVVRPSRRGTEPVYDFQVEGTHNFFANGVLVHNCLIIDDPLKDMQAADSAVEQRKVINFWEAVAQTRLAPGAPVIIIQTRWSELDLAGHVLSKDELLPPEQRQWRWINIPAISETGVPDALNRPPGVALVSARGRTKEDFERTRRDVGERVWSALYQGVPTPTGGGLFSRDWFNRHRVPEVGPTSIRIVSIDPAETGTRDEAGIIAAAATTDGRVRWTDDWSGRMRSDEWSVQAVVLALTTGATEITFEAYTTAQTYERVIKQAWKQVRAWGKLIRDLNSVDAVIAAFDTIPDSTSPDPDVLRRLDGVMVPDTDDPPFVIHPYRGRGDKVARAAGARQAASTGRLAVVGTLSELERQAVRWQQGMSSPDRMDAAVNAYERLMELIGGESVIASPYSTPPQQPAANGVPAPAPTTTPSLAALLSSPMNATNNA